MNLLQIIKKRCGIAAEITVYDEEIEGYIEDCKADMMASGVPKSIIKPECQSAVTAITFYVKAYIGDDRSDTEKYVKLYEKKVSRLALEEENVE